VALPFRRLLFAAILVSWAFCVQARAQRSGSPPDLPNPGPANSGRTLTPSTVFVSGKVVLQTGATASQIAIERVCNGVVRREGYTNTKGDFQFQLGLNSTDRDASESDSDRMVTSRHSRSSRTGGSEVRFDGCELRASLAGYSSTTVPMRAEGDDSVIQVGTIVLTRMGGVEGSTISVTSLSVPKGALEAFDRGRKAGNEKKYDEAVKELNKAVTIYPQYAAAWSLMAEIHRLRNQFDTARKEYSQAVVCDPKFVSPYFGLATIAVMENKWTEAAQYTGQVIALNQYAYPMAYYFNSAANYNLGKLDAAEQSARKFQQLDTAHARPDSALLLGNILAAKRQYPEAAQLYREYLAARPDAPNAAEVRAEAQRLEGLSSAKQQ